MRSIRNVRPAFEQKVRQRILARISSQVKGVGVFGLQEVLSAAALSYGVAMLTVADCANAAIR